jgi:16S rRNA (adenine1518-N6/adenine1519-N6)-dimethyltransferase
MGFSSKRKMLKNNLKIEESILEKIGLNPKARAENLSVEDWIKLIKMI